MPTAHKHSFVRDVLQRLTDSPAIELTLVQFDEAAAQAQTFAGNDKVAAELIATADLLQKLGAIRARDQVIVLAAIVLEDHALNGALCRKLHSKRASTNKFFEGPTPR